MNPRRNPSLAESARPVFHGLGLSLALAAALISGEAARAQAPPDGLLWSTYLGGSGNDYAESCLLPDGDLVLAGYTDSTNFPVLNAWQGTHHGPSPVANTGLGDGFIARMQGDCGGLVWSTFFGGSDRDGVLGVVAGANGIVTVCGVTFSSDFPTTAGAFQQSHQGVCDGFVARFAGNGQLLWSTLLGGSNLDTITDLAIHPTGLIVLTGATSSTNFPMAGNPYQSTNAGGYDGFVAVLDATGSNLVASTYLGGSGPDSALTWGGSGFEYLFANQLVLDHAGNPVIAGTSGSLDFPTTQGVLQASYAGGYDGVIARLDLGLTQLTYGTYVGSWGLDVLGTVALTPGGNVVVSGTTGSPNYPTTPGSHRPTYDPVTNCPYADGFVTVVDTSAAGAGQLVYSSFVGGTGCDHTWNSAVDARGRLLLGGLTEATNLPTTAGTFQATRSGSWDAYLTVLDPHQQPAAAQLRYSTYLGGSCGGYEIIDGMQSDDLGNTMVVGRTSCANFPGTAASPCVQPTYGGGAFDLFVAKMSLLPRGVGRFGHSVPACSDPIVQSVNSWPQAPNASFAIDVTGAPPNGAGAIAFGFPNPVGSPLPGFPAVDCFLGLPTLANAFVQADANGNAEFAVPIPAILPASPPHGFATQWFFLTTPQCPGSGMIGSSEGLSW